MSMRSLFLVSTLLIACLAAAAAQERMATPVRDTDAVCGECHEAILTSYLKTPMANASGLATEHLIPTSFHHAASGVDYTISTAGNSSEARLSYRLPGDPPIEGSVHLDYFLGSGHLGVTYLYSINGYLFESPIAYYSRLSGYDMKPGFAAAPQMPASLTLNDGCLRCHMSAAQKADPGTENHFSGLPFLHTGITCESCHGDTRRHILTAGKAAVVNPMKLSPERRDSTCIVCHLEGDTNVERRGRSAIAYRPGDDIRDYLSYFAYKSEDTTRRAVSEIEQFDSSMCKRMSGPSMSCMSCHDPHRSPAPAERAAYYRSKCLACHTGVKFAAQHYPQNPDCTSCHMPKNGAENILHAAWTDHRIRRAPERDQAQQAQEHGGELEPILGGESSERDLGLAYYNRAVKGETGQKGRAEQLLAAANAAAPGDSVVERTLGVLTQMDGKDSAAEDDYRASLKNDPGNMTASANLGTLLAGDGDLAEAERLWEEAFEHNQNSIGLGRNLAIVQCMLGQKAEAEKTLQTMLVYSPDLREIRSRLQAIEAGRQSCPAH